jgi:DUF1365 family protein
MAAMTVALRSCLYECTVFHRRYQPKPHEFLYRVFYLLIDLEELDSLDATLRLLKVNRRGFYSFRESDHISHGAQSIRENIVRYLQSKGVTSPVGRIQLLTLPRVLGYIFNPISIYFCHDLEGRPLTSVAEVGNTFGEWKPYLVPLASDGSFRTRVVKHFYVSPFSDLDLEFDFRFDQPGERLRLLIDDYRGGEKELVSMLTGNRVPLTDAILLRFSLKYPLLTLKVILGIHWEALRIWLKGVAARRKEWQPELQKGVHRPHKSLANHPESCAHSCGKNNDPPLSNTP